MTGGRQKTTAEYLLADKSMGVLPVSFSLMASFMSAITLLGVSAEVYFYGAQFILINISYIIGSPIAAYVFLPIFYKLKLTSVYEVWIYAFEKIKQIKILFLFFSSVSRITIQSFDTNISFCHFYFADDILQCDCSICTSISIKCCHRCQSLDINFFGRYRLYYLLYDWWNESRTLD